MPFYIPYSEDYLTHSGTKGMKWGVRRWQNYDGSFTDAGRIRYGRGDKLSRLERKAARMERKANRMDVKALKRRAKADRKARWEKKPFLRHLVRTDDVTAKLREAQRLEKKANKKRKKEEKLRTKIEELKKQKISETAQDPYPYEGYESAKEMPLSDAEYDTYQEWIDKNVG